jgi:2-dehydro-3-deoxyglucarate aldolase
VNNIDIGTWITVPHPSIVDLLSRQAFNWLCVDLEHSPVDRFELQISLSIIQGNGKKAYARVPENSHLAMKYPLDAGVDGLIVPMVNSRQEALAAVQNAFYPPKGRRGVGLSRAQGYGFAFEEHLQKNLRDFDLIVQIEHVRAVEEIEGILDVEGVSGVFVGPYDLSGSMDIPGQFDHPRMIAAIEKVERATLSKQKKLGMHVIQPSTDVFRNYASRGYNFMAFSLDTFFLGQKVSDELHKLKREI